MQKKYQYGKSIISSKYKFDFESKYVKDIVIKDEFHIELKVYCNDKQIKEVCDDFENKTIGYAINHVFMKKIEHRVQFHNGHKYYAIFNIYKKVPITRYKYIKTDTLIDTERRKYLLQERINIYL